MIPDLENWDIRILATDASSDILVRARQGLYPASSVKYLPGEHREKYFSRKQSPDEPAAPRFQISDDLRKMVTFGFHNLVADEFPADLDIIFCRNVIIYFGAETTLAILNKFFTSLTPDGALFLGYSESLNFMTDKFAMICWEEAIYYQKAAASARVSPARPAVPSVPLPSDKTLREIVEDLSRRQIAADIKTETPAPGAVPRKLSECLVEATTAFHLKKYDQA